MTALRFSTAIALLAATGIGPITSGQELQVLRDDVRTSDGRTDYEKPVERKPDSHDHEEEPCWDDSSCEDDEDPLNWLAALVTTAPYWAPAAMAGDHYQQPGYFAHFPHQYDCGYMLLDPVEAALGVPGPCEPYTWMARGRAEAGLDFDRLQWVGGQLQIDTLWRLGVEAEFRQVQEDVAMGLPDEVWLGSSNVLFRFAQSETVQMRSGLGFNFLTDEAGSDFGFNFTYGGDWLPTRPWIFSADVDLGTLGHSHAFHLRATAGMNWGISEVFVGYDYTDIGPTEIRGLVAGVRLWH